MKTRSAVAILLTALLASAAHARPMEASDLVRLRDVTSPTISPDGREVAYVVTEADIAEDEMVSHIWSAPWDGGEPRRLTGRPGESESLPKFSPDGRWIGFISARAGNGDEEEDAKTPDRLWLLPRAGGEASPIAGLAGSVVDYAFSPDGKWLAVVVGDAKPGANGTVGNNEKKRPQPIVIDRYRFKQDGIGLLDNRRQRLFLYETATGKARRLTDGDYDEMLPAWSPDGRQIAFVSRRTDDPDRSADFNIYVAQADRVGVAPRRLTANTGADAAPDSGSYPAWSPDGTTIAYTRSGDPELIWYATQRLAMVSATGGDERELTTALDRNVADPVWTPDGRAILVTVEDDRRQSLISVPVGGGAPTTIAGGDRVIVEPVAASGGRIAALSSDPQRPFEVFAVENSTLRRLSSHNETLLAQLELGRVTPFEVDSTDGVHGFVITPPGHRDGKRLPTLLYLHGGPVAQYDYSFDAMAQVVAARGYAVVMPNPRGSSGRGEAYSAAIFAAWGGVDVKDVLAATDHAVASGLADPAKLFVGGWSYGGMLTNYTIASDTRFRAAMAGASIANVYAGYGVDHYVYEYDMELGEPWKNREAWDRVSYPFLKNETIVTPTLFMVGAEDVNVPTIASEQMYQALRNRGIESRLVIYPGEAHGFVRPSFITDRMQRWLAWYEAHRK